MDGKEYVGAKISLASKSGVRYIGILNAMDLAASTVALEQVYCYTGDPATTMPRFFEYVTFRASDIQDLQVIEMPQHAKSQAPPSSKAEMTDPAVL
ncbi:Lsm14 N-terminal, partial [Piptocephalis cylindrospora]